MPPPTVCLTEADLHQVLLAQALESQAGQPDGPPLTADESVQAAVAVLHQVGEGAPAEAYLRARAHWLLARLASAAPALQAQRPGGGVAHGLQGPPAAAWALWPLLAFLLGLAGDAFSAGPRIQLLALPILGLLAWNLAVYLGLAVQALVARGRRPAALRRGALGAAPGAMPGAALAATQGGVHPLVAGVLGLAQGWWLRSAAAGQPPWLRRALRQQAAAAAPHLATAQRQRALAALHAAAAALALGAIASIYLRGLALDYRAGWDSTFLLAPQVHALLSGLLWPALQWPGLALPGVADLAALRWADGSQGAPAGPWIHRLAISLLAWVVLPRALLAGLAAWRARQAARACVLPLDTTGLAAWLPTAPARRHPVPVLPYSYQLPAASQAGLAAALARHCGLGAWPELALSLPLGAEDHLPAGLPASWLVTSGSPAQGDAPRALVVLMALTATPERETHGALLRGLARHLPPGCQPALWLDSAGFVQRLAGQPDAAQRLQQRSQAWARLAADVGWPAPVVLDLSAPAEGGSA